MKSNLQPYGLGILPTPYFNYSNTQTLPSNEELKEIALDSLKKQIEGKTLRSLLTLKTENEIEDVEYTQIEQVESKNNISTNSVGEDVIMMENTDELSEIRRKIYNIIIGAFKAKKISDSSIFCILQTIPYIDIVEDVIIVYVKKIDIFDAIEIPCVNIATALKDGFKNDNLKIKFIQCKINTISDYFSRVNWKTKI